MSDIIITPSGADRTAYRLQAVRKNLHRILLDKSNKILKYQFSLKVKTKQFKVKENHILPLCCEKYIKITLNSLEVFS